MLIRVWVDGRQPLSGTAATEGGEPLGFDGWLELLRAISQLVDAPSPSGGDTDAAPAVAASTAGKGGGRPFDTLGPVERGGATGDGWSNPPPEHNVAS